MGLNASAAGKAAGLGQDFVRDILRGKTKDPSSHRLRALAEVLDCSPEYLMGLTDEEGRAPSWLAREEINIARLTIKFELRRGYYDVGSSLIEGVYDWNYPVVSLTQPDDDEWLELVMDDQPGGLIRGSLLHVVEHRPAAYVDSGLYVVEHLRDNGSLVSRSARRIIWSQEDLYLEHYIDGVSTEDIKSALQGVDVDHFRICGVVMRAYLMTDNSGPITYA